MSTYIGTNFGYSGERFLDDRQGQANSLEDLRTWSTLVPEGFKVWVDGSWYFYDSTLPEESLTGKFHKFFSDKLTDSDKTGLSAKAIKELVGETNSSLKDLESRVFPLTLEYITPETVLYTGSQVTPEIIWKVTREGKQIIPESVTVNGSEDGVDLKDGKWTGKSQISENTIYDVVFKDITNVIEARVVFRFTNPRYWGASEYPELNSSRIQGLGKEDWGDDNIIPQTVFNCTGGKYPWIAIPSDIWRRNGEPKMWIGGLMTTDTNTYKVNVTNPRGDSVEYTCLRLGNIQTGQDLVIELK